MQYVSTMVARKVDIISYLLKTTESTNGADLVILE